VGRSVLFNRHFGSPYYDVKHIADIYHCQLCVSKDCIPVKRCAASCPLIILAIHSLEVDEKGFGSSKSHYHWESY